MIPGMTPPLRPPVKSLDDATIGRSGPHFGLSGQSSDWVALPTHSYGPGQFLLRVRVPSPQVLEQYWLTTVAKTKEKIMTESMQGTSKL